MASGLDRVRSDDARLYPSGCGSVILFLLGRVVWRGVVMSTHISSCQFNLMSTE